MSLTISGIPMVATPIRDVSKTPVTNEQYSPVIFSLLGQEYKYASVMRGVHGRIAANPLKPNDVGEENWKSLDQGRILLINGAYVYKLVAQPSPEGFNGPNQPVVNVSPVEAEGWCEFSGGQLRLPKKEEMISVLTRRGKHKFPTATGKLFDKTGKRLLHGQLKLRDGEILSAVEGDQEYNTATCDVEAKDAEGNLIYPDGSFRIRWGGNVCLWAAGDLLFGGSCFGLTRVFEVSDFSQDDPDYRGRDVGFGVVSAQDSK